MDLANKQIENKIFILRKTQVIFGLDLTEMYQVETKMLNQAVKRILNRFQLNEIEKNELVTNCDQFSALKHSSSPVYAFTEQCTAMFSVGLNSENNNEISI